MKRFLKYALWALLALVAALIVFVLSSCVEFAIGIFTGPHYEERSFSNSRPEFQKEFFKYFPVFENHIDEIEIYEDWTMIHSQTYYGRVPLTEEEFKDFEGKCFWRDEPHPEEFAIKLFDEPELKMIGFFGAVTFYKSVVSPEKNFLYFEFTPSRFDCLEEHFRTIEKRRTNYEKAKGLRQ